MIEECLVVEVAVNGDECPLADATRSVDAVVESRPPQLRFDGNALLRFSVGDHADELLATLDADDRIRYLHRSSVDGRTNVRCLSKHPCVVHQLVSAGFMAEGLRYRGGTERYTGAVVGHDVLRGVLDVAGETGGVRLEAVYPLGAEDDEVVASRWGLTPGQEEALRTAFRMGYFAVPREADAGEVAAELGVGKSAFLERLRRAEGSLLQRMFDEGEG